MAPDRALRLWPLTLVLLLLPLWAVGMFGRVYWTPDEPREADIAWNMVHQPSKAVPVMAGVAFCEKPPLAYWAAAASMAVFGKSPVAVRVPNLLWAIIAVLAIAWLAHAVAGPAAAIATGLAAGTCELSYHVAIWFASDAALVAGVALALLGAYRGLTSEHPGQKLGWYLLMHGGLALGFLAKNVIAWVIPALAILAFISWERRWRELLRVELYVGLVLQALMILPWALAVADQADGPRYLRIFFWDNLVGRFLPVASEGDYRNGHGNKPFKYLLELPVYLAPWTFLAIAAVRRAWYGVREPSGDRAAWRWAACVVIPATLLLTVSSTARGIYLAPVLPGFALAIGLWAARHLAEPDRFERVCLWATVGVVALAGIAIGPACLAFAGMMKEGMPTAELVAVVVGGLAAGALAVKMLWLQRQRQGPATLFCAVLLLDAAMLVAWRGVFPVLNRWQDPSLVAQRVAMLAENRQLVLWQPDETTRSFLDYLVDLRPDAVRSATELRELVAREPQTLVLVRRKGDAVANVARLGLVERETVGHPRGRTYTFMSLAEPGVP